MRCLAGVRFKGGIPLADGATRGWINAQVMNEGAGGGANTSDEGNDDLAGKTREAASLGSAGDIAAGAALLLDAARTASGERGFQFRLEAVRYYQRLGRADLALGIIEDLEAEARERGLESWRPSLALDLAQLAYECRSQLPDAPGAEAAFAVIARLDPKRALKLRPKGP
ncbi:MAG: type VI secretion system domain-containing protein [Gammaproteobacteria bacterium]